MFILAGIPVTNVPDYSVEEVADMTMCMILNLHCKMHQYANLVRQDVQLHNFEEMDKAEKGAIRVRGRTLGLVRLGKVLRT